LDIGDGRGLIRSKTTVLFLKDIHRGDSLTVNTRVIEICGASFIKNYQIYKEEMLMAEGETTLMVLDYNTRKPSRLPAAFKKGQERI
jgi:acyl-CoA thioesterase FadM